MDNRIKNLQFILSKLGLEKSESKSGRFEIWIDADGNLFPIPKKIDNNYDYYEGIIIDYLISKLGLKSNDYSYHELKNQIKGLNYKLISKITFKESDFVDTIPIEVAQTVTAKNVDAFRTFSNFETKGKNDIPIEKFKLNHTQKGSFIIPVSIMYEAESMNFDTIATTLNTLLHNYLQKLADFKKIDVSDKENFVSSVQEQKVTSKIVKDFLSKKDSVVSVQERYRDEIDEISITSSGSPLLDYNLTEERDFPVIGFSGLKSVPADFIEYLEQTEINENDVALKEQGIDMLAEVDSIHVNGTARFTIFSAGRETFSKPLKADTVQLTQDRIGKCAEAIKTRSVITIHGDITKIKGKIAKVIVDDLMENANNTRKTLLDI